MDATSIPDDEIFEGHRRIVVGPPPGHDVTGDIRAVEALVAYEPVSHCNVFRTRWRPTPREIERIVAGEPIWVSQFTPRMVVFSVEMTEEPE